MGCKLDSTFQLSQPPLLILAASLSLRSVPISMPPVSLVLHRLLLVTYLLRQPSRALTRAPPSKQVVNFLTARLLADLAQTPLLLEERVSARPLITVPLTTPKAPQLGLSPKDARRVRQTLRLRTLLPRPPAPLQAARSNP